MNKPIYKLLAVTIAMSATTASAQVPRVLASGAPACGNSLTKSMSKCQVAKKDLAAARRELAAALVEERVSKTSESVDPATIAGRVARARARVADAEATLTRVADFDAVGLTTFVTTSVRPRRINR